MAASHIAWFRHGLRLADQPTLLAAAAETSTAPAVFVPDDALIAPAGYARRTFPRGRLRDLRDRLGGRSLRAHGDPGAVVSPLVAALAAGGPMPGERAADRAWQRYRTGAPGAVDGHTRRRHRPADVLHHRPRG